MKYRIAEAFKNLKNAPNPSNLRVADEVRRRNLSRKERKEMKGGNGESEANVVTLCSKRAKQNDAAENLHGWRPPSGALLV